MTGSYVHLISFSEPRNIRMHIKGIFSVVDKNENGSKHNRDINNKDIRRIAVTITIM